MIPAPVEVEEVVSKIAIRYKASNGQVFVHKHEAERQEAVTYITGMLAVWQHNGWLKCHPMELLQDMLKHNSDLAECFEILAHGDDE